MKFPTLTRAHLAATVAITITAASIAGLSWAFSEQMALSSQLQREEARLEAAMDAEQARYETLRELERFVQSDKFVEDWARSGQRMKKRGERIVVSASQAPGPEPTRPAPVEEVRVREKTIWQELLQLLFGP